MRLRDVAGLCQQERDRVLRRADHVGLGCVHDHHTAPRRRLDVDVVQPDPGACDHLQIGPGREDLRRHLGPAPHDERVVRADRSGEITIGELGPDVDLEVLPEQIETLLGQLFGDHDPHGVTDSWKICSAATTAAPRFTG